LTDAPQSAGLVALAERIELWPTSARTRSWSTWAIDRRGPAWRIGALMPLLQDGLG
jgi:hypothetical protein